VRHDEDDPKLVAEGELALARLAIDSGDLPHAARHIAYALATAPTLPEAHEALTTLSVRAGDTVLDLFPVTGDVYVGAAVAHAHLVAARQPATAFDLLIAATSAVPDAPWAAVPWLEDEDFAGRWDADELAQRFMRLAGAIPEPVDPQLRPALEPYLRLARRAVAAHPQAPLLLGAASGIARRFGCVDEATDWARRAARHRPSLLTEMWLGYAHRAAGRVDDAVGAWRRALRHDPDNLALYTDLAEILAGAGRLDEALTWIDRALERDPADGCAFPTACVLRFLQDDDPIHLTALSDYLRVHPDNEHARTMLARACRDRAWLGGVSGGDDAVSDLLRQVIATEGLMAGGSARLSALEPPSAMLTLERTIPGLALTVTEIPLPDLRQPRRPDGVRLWTYDGTVARPAVPPPAPAVCAAASALTMADWPHPAAAYDAAVHLAGVQVEDLLAVLAHPPVQRLDGPPTADPGVWVRAVQAWACLGILHHGTDQPWPDSRRRRVLVDLVFGVEDWVAEAALFALVTAAWVDPSTRPDVAAVVRDRLADALQVRRSRAVSIVWSLARLALITPELDAATVRAARLILDAPSPGQRTAPDGAWRSDGAGPEPENPDPGRGGLLRRLRRR
jgi:tetratricopeptide (TPR) repeat protein